MRIICVNYLVILLVNFALSSVRAETSTTSGPDRPEYSTVLPKPIDSTNPSTPELINQTDQFASNSFQASNLSLREEIDRINRNSSSNSFNSTASLASERVRTSKLLASSGTLPFGTKLNRRPVDLPRNQSSANVDLHSNMTVISGRASSPLSGSDDLQSKRSNDEFYGDHMSAYDKIKIKNDKFSYDHFFELYDGLQPETEQEATTKSHPAKS